MDSGDTSIREIVRLMEIRQEESQAQLVATVRRLRTDLTVANDTIAALRSSTSWRVTRPLRWLTTALRRR